MPHTFLNELTTGKIKMIHAFAVSTVNIFSDSPCDKISFSKYVYASLDQKAMGLKQHLAAKCPEESPTLLYEGI